MAKINAPHLPCAKCKENERVSESYCRNCLREKNRRASKKFSKTEKYKENQSRYKKSEKGKETARRLGQSDRCKETRRIYVNSEKGKESIRVCNKKQRLNEPIKTAVRRAVWDALKSGKIIRKPCEVCGEVKVDCHHDSYLPEDRLKVRFLCRQCHVNWHKENTTIGGD